MVVRLSEGLEKGGALKKAAVMRGLDTLEKLVDRFDLKNKPLRAVATAVLRMTSDPLIFTIAAKEILGVDIEILTGEEEAMFGGFGAVFGLGQSDSWIVCDIGGQSTEVSWKSDYDAGAVSLPMGVVGLTADFAPTDPPLAGEIEALCKHARATFKEKIPSDLKGELIGVAGTATTVAMLDLQLKTWQREKVHGHKMDRGALCMWRDKMASITARERTNVYGVRHGRADVFPAGLSIMDELMKHLGRNNFIASANGLRVGVAIKMLQEKQEY